MLCLLLVLLTQYALPESSLLYVYLLVVVLCICIWSICVTLFLQGCLPLVLMFDLKDETGAVMNDIVGLAQLMEALDVFISVKPKPKQLSKVAFVMSTCMHSSVM